MLRYKDLCPGPTVCPDVLMEDPQAGADALPCPECPWVRLREYLASPGGNLISAVIDLDFAIQSGVNVRLAEIPYPDFLLLRLLAEERQKWESEEMRKKR